MHGTMGNEISKRKAKAPQKPSSPAATGPNVWKGRLRDATQNEKQLASIGSVMTETLQSSSRWSGRLRNRVQINSTGSSIQAAVDRTLDNHLNPPKPFRDFLNAKVLFTSMWLIEDGRYFVNFNII
jgi:hypothetical protein